MLAQVVLFVLGPYMTASEKIVWCSLPKVCFPDYKATYKLDAGYEVYTETQGSSCGPECSEDATCPEGF